MRRHGRFTTLLHRILKSRSVSCEAITYDRLSATASKICRARYQLGRLRWTTCPTGLCTRRNALFTVLTTCRDPERADAPSSGRGLARFSLTGSRGAKHESSRCLYALKRPGSKRIALGTAG